MQIDLRKVTEIGENVVELTASSEFALIFMCCAIILFAKGYLISRNYQRAKRYIEVAIWQFERIFGFDCGDGSLSAWRRRNMTIMAITSAYLGEYELVEVILASVYIEAARYSGLDARLSP